MLRAELPGVEPEKDIQLSVQGNEFSYGKFARTVRLPAGALPEEVAATYEAGILDVTVPVRPEMDVRKIEVKVTT